MNELMDKKISEYKELLTKFIELVENNSNRTTKRLEMLAKDLLEEIDNNKNTEELYDRLRYYSIDFENIQNYYEVPYIDSELNPQDIQKNFKNVRYLRTNRKYLKKRDSIIESLYIYL